MARPPNFDFERRERQKAKDAKRAAKAEAKRQGKGADAGGTADDNQAQPPIAEQMETAIAKDKIQND